MLSKPQIFLIVTVISQEISPLPKNFSDRLTEVFHNIRNCKVMSGRQGVVIPTDCLTGNGKTENARAVLNREVRGILKRKIEMKICETDPCQRKSLYIPVKVRFLYQIVYHNVEFQFMQKKIGSQCKIFHKDFS